MKWYLTQKATEEPEIDVREEDEDLGLGYSLLRRLSEEPGSGLREIAPGVWLESKDGADPLL